MGDARKGRRIQAHLEQSLKSGIAISIKLKQHQQTIFTAVRSYIKRDSLQLIELMPYSLYGNLVTETIIHISDIENLTLLNVLYNDPVYVRLRDKKKKIK